MYLVYEELDINVDSEWHGIWGLGQHNEMKCLAKIEIGIKQLSDDLEHDTKSNAYMEDQKYDKDEQILISR